MIEVEGPDGTVIEFPEGTAPETIKGVMAKRYPSTATKRVAQLPDGGTLEIDVPEGADAATVERIGQEALNARNVRGRAVAGTTQPGVMGDVANLGTNLAKGAAYIPDFIAGLGDKVSSGIGNALDFFMTGGGASPGSALAMPDRPVPSIRGALDQLNPDAGQAPSAFAAQVLGSMVLPIGPKAAPVRPSAPRVVTPAPAVAAKGAIPNAPAVVAAGDREGVRVLTSDVKPPRTFIGKSARAIGERIPMAGTGGQRAAQNEERVGAVQNLLTEFGASDDALNAVSADLVKTRGAELSKLTTAKKAVIESIPGIAPATNALAAIDSKIAELAARNTPTSLGVAEKLKELRPGFEGKSLAQLEAMRADELSDVFKGDSLAHLKTVGEKALRSIYGPLRDDMGAFIAERGGSAAAAKWKAANERLAAMAGELDAAAFKGLLNKAETTPEAAAGIIFGKTPSDMKRLYGSLSDAGKIKAQSAILYEAARRATTDDVVSPQKFATAMEAMERATGTFFSPADKARIDGFTRLLKATQQSSVAAAAPPTGVQNAAPVMGAGFIGLFGGMGGLSAAGGYGLLARAYESKVVRDRLLRLGKTKPGSKAERFVMRDLSNVLARITPAAANDVEGAVALSPSRAAAQDERD